MITRLTPLVGLSAIALVAAACGQTSTGGSSGSSTMAPSGPAVRTARIGGATVLTNAQGRTLYWFVPDTATKSNCNGSCARYWPPLKGPVTAGSGVTGTLGTIKRSDGSSQATYNGHPLYTYIADTGPGQATGNGLNASGGLWYEMTVSGPAHSPSHSPSGGYGY